MLKKKSQIIIVLIFTLLYPINCFCAPWIDINIIYDGKTSRYNAENVYLYVNGKRAENLSMPAIIFNGSTLVPAREVFEPLGANVVWKKETEEVDISYKNTSITIKINSETASVNNNTYTLSMPAKIINNKTMIPVRFIAESLGLAVEWDAKKRIINIREKADNLNNDIIAIDPPADLPATEESAAETTTSEETVTERDPVNLDSPKCDDGIFKISADGKLGDFATTDIKNRKISYLLGKATPPDEKEYEFDDSYIKKVTFDETVIKGKKFTKITLDLKTSGSPVSYISKDSKTFIVDFINDKPKFDNLYVTDLDEEPLSSDYDLEEEPDIGNNNASDTSQILSDDNIFFKDGYLYIKKNSNFNINNITFTDNYQYKEYIINTYCDLSNTLKDGKYLINNELIETVEIKNSNFTEIKIKEKKILAYNIVENTDYICVNPVHPKEKYPKIVVIDAGHGGSDPGAISQKNNIIEKDLTLSIANKVVDLLEKNDRIKVYAVRLDDTFYTRPERAALANEIGDMFISIHANSFSGEKANGTEIWYYPHTNDNTIGLSCEQLAQCLRKNLINNLKSADRGTKSTNYDVLTLTEIPASLCEIGFITNPEEAENLKNDEYKNLAADAIYKAIIESFEKYTPQR